MDMVNSIENVMLSYFKKGTAILQLLYLLFILNFAPLNFLLNSQ